MPVPVITCVLVHAPLPLLLSSLHCLQPLMNLTASQLNPKSHAWPAAASTLATAGTCSLAQELAYTSAQPGASCSCCAHIAGGMCTEPHQACGLQGCCRAAAAWACVLLVVPAMAFKFEDFAIDHPGRECKSQVGGQDHPGLASTRCDEPPPWERPVASPTPNSSVQDKAL